MRFGKRIKYLMVALIFVAAVSGLIHGGNAQETAHALMPAHLRVWEDEAIHGLELPRVDRPLPPSTSRPTITTAFL